MKANVFNGEDFDYIYVPVPTIGPGEVLLKMEACGLCGTDVQKAVRKKVPSGVVLGHEYVGTVVEVGEGVTRFRTGERVAGGIHVPCYTCHECSRGYHTLCHQFKKNNILPGGFAEYIRVPKEHVNHLLYSLPSDLSTIEASLLEPIACCIHGQKVAEPHPGDSVLIMGAGQIGAIHVQLAKINKASRVMISDYSSFKLQKAKELGADDVIDLKEMTISEFMLNQNESVLPDIIYIAASVPKLLSEAIQLIRPGGKIIVFSPLESKNVSIDASKFFDKMISVIGSYSTTPFEFEEAMILLKQGLIDTKTMITDQIPLNKLNDAIQLSLNPHSQSLKIIIVPEEQGDHRE